MFKVNAIIYEIAEGRFMNLSSLIVLIPVVVLLIIVFGKRDSSAGALSDIYDPGCRGNSPFNRSRDYD